MRLPGKPIACTVTATPNTAEASAIPQGGLTVTARAFRVPGSSVNLLMQPVQPTLTMAQQGADVTQWRVIFCDDLSTSDWYIPVGAAFHTPDGPASGYPIVAVAPYPGSHVEVTVSVAAL